jgi:hypothetical protein
MTTIPESGLSDFCEALSILNKSLAKIQKHAIGLLGPPTEFTTLRDTFRKVRSLWEAQQSSACTDGNSLNHLCPGFKATTLERFIIGDRAKLPPCHFHEK